MVVRTTSNDQTLITAASKMGLPVFQPKSVNDPAFVAEIAALKPDLNLSISYNQILRPPWIDLAPQGFVNFHAGKLPNYRGRNVINWALINGETEIGLTAHFIDEGIDTGDIISQQTLPVAWTDTYGDVLEATTAALPDLVSKTVRLISDGQAQRQPQSHLPGTYYAGREDGDEWLDWSDTSFNLHNKVRAITDPGPGARTILGEKTVIIWRAYYDPQWPSYIATPGQIVGRGPDEGVVVKTGDSTLLIKEAQLDGGNRKTPTWATGTRFGINWQANLSALQSELRRLKSESGDPANQ